MTSRNIGVMTATGNGRLDLWANWPIVGMVRADSGSTVRLPGSFDTTDFQLDLQGGSTARLEGTLENTGRTFFSAITCL